MNVYSEEIEMSIDPKFEGLNAGHPMYKSC